MPVLQTSRALSALGRSEGAGAADGHPPGGAVRPPVARRPRTLPIRESASESPRDPESAGGPSERNERAGRASDRPDDRRARRAPATADGIRADEPDSARERRLAELLEAGSAAMVRLLRSLCGGDRGEADELWQRAQMRAWTYRHSLRADGEPTAWLRRIVFRVWLDEKRRRARRPEVLEPSLEPVSESDTAERGAIAREELDGLLALLSPVERFVLLRMHRHGDSVGTIAAALDIPANTVKSHARRGRERMLAEWRRRGGTR